MSEHNYKSNIEEYIVFLQKLIEDNKVESNDNLKTFLIKCVSDFIQNKKSTEEEVKTCQYCCDGEGCYNCEYFGFPCLNCAEYCYHFRLGPGHGKKDKK